MKSFEEKIAMEKFRRRGSGRGMGSGLLSNSRMERAERDVESPKDGDVNTR